MGIFIKDAATDKAIRKLAKLRGATLTETVRDAITKELQASSGNEEDVWLAKLDKKLSAHPKSALKADKAFYDSLYED